MSSLKSQFFPGLEALLCICASSWAPPRSPILFFKKQLVVPFFYSFNGMVSISQRSQRYSWNTFTKRPVAPFLASPISLPLSSASRFLLRVTLTRFALSSYNRAFRLPTSVPISGFARLGEKLKIFLVHVQKLSVLLPAHAFSCFPPEKPFLLALPLLLGAHFPSKRSSLFLHHVLALAFLFLAKMWLLPTFTLFHLTIT